MADVLDTRLQQAQTEQMARIDLSALAIARADGRYPKLLESLAKTEVLVMDDWGLAGLAPFTAENRHDLLEVLEDRHGVRSTVVTSHSFPSTSGTRCESEAGRRPKPGTGTDDSRPASLRSDR